MTSNAEIAKAMADNMTHAAVPLYGKKLRLPDRGAIIGIIKEFRRLLFPAYFGDAQLMALPPENYAALLLDREEIDNRFIWHDAIKVIPVYIIVVYVIALGCSYILP